MYCDRSANDLSGQIDKIVRHRPTSCKDHPIDRRKRILNVSEFSDRSIEEFASASSVVSAV
jgi:hypothetical protein